MKKSEFIIDMVQIVVAVVFCILLCVSSVFPFWLRVCVEVILNLNTAIVFIRLFIFFLRNRKKKKAQE